MAAPPSSVASLEAASAFQAWAVGSPSAAELKDLLLHSDLPGGVTDSYAARVVASLSAEGALGQILRTAEPQIVLIGPDYSRVLFTGEPMLSLVVRADGEGAKVDRLEITTCRLCSEPVRAVRDMLARNAAGTPVLLPNLDLSVRGAREDHQIPAQRVAALQKRAMNGDLRDLLRSARVLSAQDHEVEVQIGDRAEVWPMIYDDRRWMIDYAALADDSVLRLSRHDAEDFRPDWRRTTERLDAYETDLGVVPGGVLLARRSIGAAFDPRDGSVLSALYDVDRTTAGVFRLDPDTGAVLDRWAIRPAPRIPIDLETWFDSWFLAVSPDGRQVAVSSPGQVDVVDLLGGKRSLVFAFDQASHLEWVDTELGAVLVIGQRTATHMVHGTSHHSAHVEAPTVGAYGSGEGVGILTEDGSLVHYDLRTREITEQRHVCCGAARGLAASETRSEILVTCPQTCESAAERLPYRGAGRLAVDGSGTRGRGAAWSPDGTIFATSAMGASGEGFLLWTSRGEPIAAAGSGRVRSLVFDPRGETILSVTSDGEVQIFRVDEVRARGLASSPPAR